MSKTIDQIREESMGSIDESNDILMMAKRFGNFDPRLHLRKIRQIKGISLIVLSEKTGIDHAAISKFERGLRDMRFSSVMKIILALDCFMMFVGDYMYTPVEYNHKQMPKKISQRLQKIRQGKNLSPRRQNP